MSLTRNTRVRTAQFNTSNINDLAGSLAQAFSINGSTGITFSNLNTTKLNVGQVNATGLNITNLSITNITGTNAFFTNLTFTSSTGIINFMTGGFLSFILATGQSLQLLQSGTNRTYNSNQFYQAPGNNLSLGSTAVLTGSNNNIAIGANSLINLSQSQGNSNQANLAVGVSAGTSLITGSNNTFIGDFAGQNVSQGTLNTFVGRGAGFAQTNSNLTANTVIGYDAGVSISGSSSFNTLVGYQAGLSLSTGSNNTLLGSQADVIATNNVSNSISIGNSAVVGASNIAVIGNNAITNILPGTGSTCDLGISYQSFNTLWANNITGTNAFFTNLTFTSSTGIINFMTGGFLSFILATGQSLQLLQSGTNRTYNSNQFYQTPVGDLVLGSNATITGTIGLNLAIGGLALSSMTQSASNGYNIAVGYQSLQNFVTGQRNTVIGVNAGINFGQGDANVLIGNLAGAGQSQANFNNNVCIGRNAGINMSGNNVANNNVYIGDNAGTNTTINTTLTLIGAQTDISANNTTISNSIGLGYQANIGASNVAVIGNNAITNILPGTGSTCDLGISYQPFRSIYLTGSVNGSVAVANGSFTGTSTTYAILFTGANGTLILPNPNTVPGITYKIFNNTAGNITATGAFINGTGSTPFTLVANHTPVQITSDGIASFWLI